MNFPKYWARGEHKNFIAWRWSDASLAEAAALAADAARGIAEQFAAGTLPPPGTHYGYPDRPMREPVLREFRDLSGGLTAAVTRNAYGCQVLNTARAMFVDVDLPEPKRAGGGFFNLFFGKKPEPAPAGNPAETPVLAQADGWARRNPGWNWRVYRTRAGLRLLATHDLFDPEAAETQAVFEALGADPLYRRLCGVQKCFRARLTPKPWRCGLRNPYDRWPWPDAKAEKRFNAWEAEYREASEEYATCELIATLGCGMVHQDIRPILDFHDQATRVNSKLKLA
jgi:hypothetical protein